MNFKDLQYSIGRLTTDVRSHMARNNPLQKQDTKALSMWIFNERNNLATMRTLAYQQSETIKVFQQWTKEELLNDKEENGRDIEDIGDKLVKLLEKQTEIEQQYAAKYQQYRHAIKSIRDREDRLSDIREKKRTLSSRISNLSKTSPKSPKLQELTKELASLDRDTHDTELEMGDFKRFALKEAFYLRFNAMTEHAEKTAMIAGFGKYIVDLLDIAPTPPTEPARRTYDKGIQAAMIFADAVNAIDAWQPQEGDERPTIAANMSKHQGTDASAPDDDTISVDTKGKEPQQSSFSPPRLPPRSPVPSHHPSLDDHPSQDTTQDLDQVDLYDGPPPAYQPSQVNAQDPAHEKERLEQERLEQERLEKERLEKERLEKERLEQERLEQERLEQERLEQERLEQEQREQERQQDQQRQNEQQEQQRQKEQQEQQRQKEQQEQQRQKEQQEQQRQKEQQEQQRQKEQQEQQLQKEQQEQQRQKKQQEQQQLQDKASDAAQETKQPIPDIEEPSSPFSPPPAPSATHARPIAHEDKEQINEDGFESPYQSHHMISTPSTPQYQQSPLPMHPYGTPQPSHWSYGGVEPKYHHGQYQQLYDQVTERQQQTVQRPYSDFQQQYMRKDAGGFRIPTNDTTGTLSADEEKRLLAERYAKEETQARQASLQSQKKSVILPEGDNHGYKPSPRK